MKFVKSIMKSIIFYLKYLINCRQIDGGNLQSLSTPAGAIQSAGTSSTSTRAVPSASRVMARYPDPRNATWLREYRGR